MLIFEVEQQSDKNDSAKLMALSHFLSGRAEDTQGKKQISSNAFIDLARGLGVNVTADTLGDLVAKPPLSNILEPYEPNSNIVKFKGNDEPSNVEMDSTQAQEVVNQNAKAAMKRGTK